MSFDIFFSRSASLTDGQFENLVETLIHKQISNHHVARYLRWYESKIFFPIFDVFYSF